MSIEMRSNLLHYGRVAAVALSVACAASLRMSHAMASDPELDEEQRRQKAMEILGVADRAMGDVQQARCTVDVMYVGALAGMRDDIDDASVLVQRQDTDDAPIGWRFDSRGTVQFDEQSGLVGQRASCDGSTFTYLDLDEPTMVTMPAMTILDVVDGGARATVGWIVRWNDLVHVSIFDDEMDLAPRYEGEKRVRGVLCDVVKIDVSSLSFVDEFEIWYFFDQTTHLPRRIDTLFYDVDATTSDGVEIVYLDNLVTDESVLAEIADSVFEIELPEGYALDERKPETDPYTAPEMPSLAGKDAPQFELRTVSGDVVRLSDLRGDVVVLDFWATWCGPCVAAMPAIQRVHEKYSNDRFSSDHEVHILGMNTWESGDPGAFLKQQKITYPTLLGADNVARDYMVSGIPTMVVIGRDGKVSGYHVGFDPNLETVLEKEIDRALNAQP